MPRRTCQRLDLDRMADPRPPLDLEDPGPSPSDPGLYEAIADACSGGCPRLRRDVMTAILCDALGYETNSEAADRLGTPRQTALDSRRRGMQALRRHRATVAALLGHATAVA